MDEDLAAPPGPAGRHPLPAAEDFARAASRAGIGEGVFVVAYGNMGGAERLWWLLRHFGHDDCAVLELERLARAASRRRGGGRAGRVRAAGRAAATRSSADELAARLDELVVVDARSPERYRGEPNPIDKVPGPDPRSA